MSVRVSCSNEATCSARKRVAYSLAAGAVAGCASNANAYVFYSGVQNTAIAFGGGSFDLDINDNSFVDVYLKNYSFSGGPYQGLTIRYGPGKVVGFTAGRPYVTALGAGVLVDQSALGPSFYGSLAFGAHNPNAQFNNVDHAFIGLSYPVEIGSSYFGWIRVTIDNANHIFIVNDWATELSQGVGIVTGDTGAGDFNGDRKVDAADYVTWRRALGTSNTLLGHGDDSGASAGTVDAADLAVWRANFGHPTLAGSGTSLSTAVPEPITLGLLAAGSVGLLGLRRSRREK